MVAGQDAEAAGVVRQRLGDAELHREVGDGLPAATAPDRHLVLVPARVLQVVVQIGGQAVHPGQERLVAGQFLQPGHRDRAEQLERVALEPGPELPVDVGEQVLAGRVPGPAQVADQRTERLQRRRQLRSDGESSESLHQENLALTRPGCTTQRVARPERPSADKRAGGIDLARSDPGSAVPFPRRPGGARFPARAPPSAARLVGTGAASPVLWPRGRPTRTECPLRGCGPSPATGGSAGTHSAVDRLPRRCRREPCSRGSRPDAIRSAGVGADVQRFAEPIPDPPAGGDQRSDDHRHRACRNQRHKNRRRERER